MWKLYNENYGDVVFGLVLMKMLKGKWKKFYEIPKMDDEKWVMDCPWKGECCVNLFADFKS